MTANGQADGSTGGSGASLIEPFVLATGNADKAREVAEILVALSGRPVGAHAVDVGGVTIGFVIAAPEQLASVLAGLPELTEVPDVAETAASLEGNARIKAAAVGRALALLAIADDTGLEVDALGGAPGVRSARFAGDEATSADNVALLLDRLRGVPPERRTARFVTVALAWSPEGWERSARGEVTGQITQTPRGTGGFGYDPVFVPDEGDGRTFAEMSAEDKHRISHRGRAFRALFARLARLAGPDGDR